MEAASRRREGRTKDIKIPVKTRASTGRPIPPSRSTASRWSRPTGLACGCDGSPRRGRQRGRAASTGPADDRGGEQGVGRVRRSRRIRPRWGRGRPPAPNAPGRQASEDEREKDFNAGQTGFRETHIQRRAREQAEADKKKAEEDKARANQERKDREGKAEEEKQEGQEQAGHQLPRGGRQELHRQDLPGRPRGNEQSACRWRIRARIPRSGRGRTVATTRSPETQRATSPP